MEVIRELGLYDIVFNVPTTINLSPRPASTDSAFSATILLQRIITGTLPPELPGIHQTLIEHVTSTAGAKGRLFLGAALTPFAGSSFPQKKRTRPGAEAAVWEGLRLGTQGHYLDGVPLLFEAATLLRQPRLDRWTTPSDRVALGEFPPLCLKNKVLINVGLVLRDKNVHNPLTGTLWQSSILFSLLQELVECYDLERQTLDSSLLHAPLHC